MFLSPANLPGIDIQPLDLFPTGAYSEVRRQAIDNTPGVKYSVFFDDVRIHESNLIGGERDGWQVTGAALALEHAGSGAGIARNLVVEKFLDQCKNNPTVANRIKENPQLLTNIVDVYIATEIERLFQIRNAWNIILR